MVDTDPSLPARATSRRALTRGMVWSVPVASVAAAAPAFAASSCGQRLDWDIYTGTTPPASITVGGVVITRAVVPVSGGAPTASNNTVFAGPRGGIGESALALSVANPVAGRGLSMAFTFAPAIYDLRFSVFDVDAVSGGWQDRVTPTPSGFSEPVARGSNVTRFGDSFTTPYSVNLPDTSGAGNFSVLYAGPIAAMTVTYVCGPDAQGGGNMAVFLSDLTFCLNP